MYHSIELDMQNMIDWIWQLEGEYLMFAPLYHQAPMYFNFEN